MCAYSFFCPCWAAGDVARFTGRNPYLSIAGLCCCVGPCFCWKQDRESVVRYFNLKAMDSDALFCLLVPCLLAQTLNHIKAAQLSDDLATAALVSFKGCGRGAFLLRCRTSSHLSLISTPPPPFPPFLGSTNTVTDELIAKKFKDLFDVQPFPSFFPYSSFSSFSFFSSTFFFWWKKPFPIIIVNHGVGFSINASALGACGGSRRRHLAR